MKKKHTLRRIVLTSAATVSGLVLLLSLKPTTDPSVVRADVSITPSGQTASASSAPPSAPASASSGSPSVSASRSRTVGHKSPSSSPSGSASHSASPVPRTTSSVPSAPTTTPAVPTTRTVTGPTVQTKYGPVQVRITLTGSKITKATAIQSPDSLSRSQEISSTAVPQLNQETLAAQSANIDSVSGATYTSAGYKQSLQSALDTAGV